MSMVDAWGVRVSCQVDRRPDLKMSEDMILIALRARRMSIRNIGRVFKISHVAVLKRWKAIPEDVRSHYAKSLG